MINSAESETCTLVIEAYGVETSNWAEVSDAEKEERDGPLQSYL